MAAYVFTNTQKETQDPKQKKPLSRLEITLIIGCSLLLIGVLIEVFLVISRSKPQNNQTPSPVQQSQDTQTTTQQKTLTSTEWQTYEAKTSGLSFQYPIVWHIIASEQPHMLLITNKDQTVAMTIADQQLPYYINPKAQQQKTNLSIHVDGKPYTLTQTVLDNTSVFVNFVINAPHPLYVMFGSGTPVPFTTASLTAYQAEQPTLLKILESIKIIPIQTPTPIASSSGQVASSSAH